MTETARLEQRVAERTAALEKAYAEIQSRAYQQESVALLGQKALAGLDLDSLMQQAAKVVHECLPSDCTDVWEFDEAQATLKLCASLGWPEPRRSVLIPFENDTMLGYTLHDGGAVIAFSLDSEPRFKVDSHAISIGARSCVSVCIKAGERPLGVICVFSLTARAYAPDDVSFLQSVSNVLSAAVERHQAEQRIRQAQAEAEAANRAKSEFLSRMSHELRTPLNSILGFTQLLEMEQHDSRQDESIRLISRAGENLLTLINEVLDIARLDAGRMPLNIETIDLGELLREVIALPSAPALRNNITVRLAEMPTETPYVLADLERLKQVFVNLLSNAGKFNTSGGSVMVTLTQAEPGFWRVSITDTGAGIPEEKLSQLFVPFAQISAKDAQAEGGRGLGLALCHRIVSALGGKIGATSAVGIGSTFWVNLPASEIPAHSNLSTITLEPPQQQAQHTLIYIEDDLVNFYLIERILDHRKDIRLLSALQGRAGLDLLRENKPDLLLLDLNLPDMPGEQFLRMLRDNPATAGIPVIVVTGEVASDRFDTLYQLGVLEIVMKPYRVQDLLALIQRVLG